MFSQHVAARMWLHIVSATPLLSVVPAKAGTHNPEGDGWGNGRCPRLQSLPVLRATRRMGPCLRRDDGDDDAAPRVDCV